MSSDAAAKLWDNTINRGIFDLVHSQNNHEKLGGLLAIGALPAILTVSNTKLCPCIDNLLDRGVEGGVESKKNLFRFYNYVTSLLPNVDINVMLAASKTLGQIAHVGGASFAEPLMVKEVSSAIELLQTDKQETRHAGVLILKELARNSPTYFYLHINLVFDKILVPLRDTRVIVREGAAELLAACLAIVTQRERQPRSPYLFKISQDAAAGLKGAQPEYIHGSLLIYRELLIHGGGVRV